MYAVSDAFLTAVAANTRSYYWAGTVYSSELGITLLSEVDRYTLRTRLWRFPAFCGWRTAVMRKCRWVSLKCRRRTDGEVH